MVSCTTCGCCVLRVCTFRRRGDCKAQIKIQRNNASLWPWWTHPQLYEGTKTNAERCVYLSSDFLPLCLCPLFYIPSVTSLIIHSDVKGRLNLKLKFYCTDPSVNMIYSWCESLLWCDCGMQLFMGSDTRDNRGVLLCTSVKANCNTGVVTDSQIRQIKRLSFPACQV